MPTESNAAISLPIPIEAPKSFEELTEREAFRAPIDPKDHKLTEVLAQYNFSKKAPCGLSSCRTEHNYGFLVRTASGVETNIGNVCGKTYFGDDFVLAASVHRRKVARQDVLRTLNHLRQQQPIIEAQIALLIDGPFGVRWLLRLKASMQKRLGSDGMQFLARRVRTQDYRVEDVTERTEEEIQNAMAYTNRKRDDVRYKTEVVGSMAPMPWLAYDFKGELIDGLQEPLRIACNVDDAVTETRVLQRLVKPLGAWEKTLEQTQEVLRQAPASLVPQNLMMVSKAVLSNRPGAKAPDLAGWEKSSDYQSLVSGAAK